MDNKLKIEISEIDADLEGIENDKTLNNEINFFNRADAIDFIDFHIIERIDMLSEIGSNKQLDNLKLRAELLKRTLEKIDFELFQQIREKIGSGFYTKSSFADMVNSNFLL